MSRVKKKSAKSPDYSVPALDKGLDILEALAEQRRPLPLIELARLLNRNTNEIFRMVDCLARRGYLIREPEKGDYRLSLRLFELAQANPPIRELMRASDAPMRSLVEAMGESCHLSVLSEHDLVVLAQAEARHPVRISIEPGARFPAKTTASGKLLLAFLPEDELARLFPSPRQDAALFKRFTDIRGNGYCLDIEASRRGVMDLAVLVGAPAARAACALTVTALGLEPAGDFLRRVLPSLKSAAEAITAASGLARRPLG